MTSTDAMGVFQEAIAAEFSDKMYDFLALGAVEVGTGREESPDYPPERAS